jgi:hypothetical protein
MHQVGELFIEAITEVTYDPVVVEASDHGRTAALISLKDTSLAGKCRRITT